MIAKTVWRKGWPADVEETQAAATALSRLIHFFEDCGRTHAADDIRLFAMERGARHALAQLSRVAATLKAGGDNRD
jgi:hypothetical protein